MIPVPESRRLKRIALYGYPGAGKSTAARILKDQCQGRIWFARIRIAQPLYEAQSDIYQRAGRQLRDFYQQDGELLNLLGIQLRRLNPRILEDRFASSVRESLDRFRKTPMRDGLIVCDDVRYPDVHFIRGLGFDFVQMHTPKIARSMRRHRRGDVSLGSVSDPNEQFLDRLVPDKVLDNSGDLSALSSAIASLLKELMDDPDG